MAVHTLLPHMHIPRGDAAVKRSSIPTEPNIVETYKIGNTTIRIADNYVNTDPEEIEEIMRRFHGAVWRIIDDMDKREGH